MRGSLEFLRWRSRLELIESASPIAFAEHSPDFPFMHPGCQLPKVVDDLYRKPRNSLHWRVLGLTLRFGR